ncbi:sensor histidine kinase [Edaphobacter albus]|uniref:sensor histidine kinase n=1 Tax=Edaphobacter sp. 4G125 TaxID=2763071 RepID=UPI0016463666|nr:sensor histidine kinase [Edaphobacter sp. 4G125]QNI35425.1 CHASE3 domain-containing protein [Edaphobacter sp. 4G125]
MKSRPSRLLIPALLVLAAIVVALNAWFGFRAIQSLHDSEYWVAHTWQDINQVESIMGSVKDAETGSRGYLISGDEAYLEPYTIATRELPEKLNYFAELTSDNPSQGQRLVEMRAVLEERLNLLQQGIDLRHQSDRETVRTLVLSGTGKAEMDHLRRIADDMEGEERRLLAIRTATVDDDNRRAHYIIALASALDLLFIVFLFRSFAIERQMRYVAELDAERLTLAQAEAERHAEESRILNETLEQRVKDRTRELESINHELEAFSYSVSHDLRAPLRTIDGFSLALEEDYRDAVDATGRDYIQRIRSGVQRMGQLIDALLQLSRITRAEITRQSFNISYLAESVASALVEENSGNRITFQIEPDLQAEGDPRLVRIALENLLGNAVKFSSKKPEIAIQFGRDREKNAWFIRDNGAGFDMSYADKLFNAFNRLHGDKDFRGSGIGLATVARIIHRHHGRVWAHSEVGNGATFWFTLG